MVQPSQFPGFANLQYAQSPSLADTIKSAAGAAAPMVKAAGGMAGMPGVGGAVPGAQGPTSIGGAAGPQPLVPPGTPPQSPSLMDALKNMSPSQIMASLSRVAQPPQPGMPGAPPGSQMAMPGAQGPMMPGSALFSQAGMGQPPMGGSTYGG